jgi:hypothetical protein
MTERTSARVSLRMDLDLVSVAALVLIGLQLVVRLVVVLPSYYWQDDFIHLDLARREGLTADFLVRDYNDHLEIVPNFLYWLLSQSATTSFVPAALLIVGLQLLAAVVFWRLLRALFGSRAVILVPLAMYLFTPLALVTSTWLAAALEALTFQIAFVSVMLATLRFHETGRSRWVVLSLVAYALGMLSWEKALLVLPAVMAMHVLVVWRFDPFATRLARLRAHWRMWGAHGVVLVGYLGLYLSVTDGSERLEASAAPYLRSAGTMLVQVFVPGILGGPWHTAGSENTLYPRSSPILVVACLLLVALLVAASFLWSGPAAAGPWSMIALYVAGDIALMLWGRASYLDLVNRDPRYLADAAPVVAICVTAAFVRSEERRRRGFRWPLALDPAVLRATPVAAAAVLLSSSLLTTFLQAPVMQRSYSRNYVEGLVTNFEQNPGASIVDTEAPVTLGQVDQQQMLAAVGFEAPFDQPGVDMLMFDSLAQLRPIELRDVYVEERGPEPDCGWAVRRRPVTIGTLPPSESRVSVLRVGYVTGAPARLHVAVDGVQEAVEVEPGLGYVHLVVTGLSGDIEVWARRTLVGLCVSDFAAGRPWPRD